MVNLIELGHHLYCSYCNEKASYCTFTKSLFFGKMTFRYYCEEHSKQFKTSRYFDEVLSKNFKFK